MGGSSYSLVLGNPPKAVTRAFLFWACQLATFRINEIGPNLTKPVRATVLHFAQSGNDSTGDGSTGNPYKSIAKANALMAADTEFSFFRGDQWKEDGVGLLINQANVSVTSWSNSTTGNKPAPNFTQFLTTYSSGWTNAGNGTYTRTETNAVGWVRYAQFPERVLMKCASTAECIANPDSWYYDSGGTTLHVNPNSSDITTSQFFVEMAKANSVPGIESQFVDGTWIEGIWVDGYGAGDYSNSIVGFWVRTEFAERAVVKDCQCRYGPYHLMGNTANNNAGGFATFWNCRIFGATNGSTGMYIAHNGGGGQECIFLNCRVGCGTLPETSWFNASTQPRNAACTAVFGHTAGSGPTANLQMSIGTIIENVPFGCAAGSGYADVPGDGTLPNIRAFVVGERMLGGAGVPQPAQAMNVGSPNNAYINCQWEVTKMGSEGAQATAPLSGYLINCIFDGNGFNFSTDGAGGSNSYKAYHCRFNYRYGGITFPFHSINFGALETGIRCEACQFSYDREFTAGVGLAAAAGINLDNVATVLKGNQYVRVPTRTGTTPGGPEGYDADATLIESTDVHVLVSGAPCDDPVEYDFNYQPRNVAQPMRGPFEASLLTKGAMTGGSSFASMMLLDMD